MNYNDTNYKEPYKIYLSSSGWNQYISAIQQEPITLTSLTPITPDKGYETPDEGYMLKKEYKEEWGKYYTVGTRAFEDYSGQLYEAYQTIKNNRLNKPNKEKNKLLSWIDNK